MRRVACLATVTMLGVTLAAVSNEAQQARHRIRPLELTDNLYMLTSDPAEQGLRTGGNTAVFVTSDGVVLVDTKYKEYGSDILAEVGKITAKPVTTIINTHTHYDHSGSNTEFPDTVNIVAHANTAAHMASSDCDDGMGFEGGSIKNCEHFQGENRKFLPDTTFSTRHTLFSGADQIDLYYFGRGHTDGDTFVVFKEARTVHTGDMFARKGLPFIDAANTNGSATEFGATLQKAVDGIPDVDTVIPGHADDPLVWQDLVDYAGFYNDILMKTQQGKAAGRSAAEIISSYSLPDRYRDFAAPTNRLEGIVPLMLEGRSRGRRAPGGRPPARTAGLGGCGAGRRGPR